MDIILQLLALFQFINVFESISTLFFEAEIITIHWPTYTMSI